MSWLFVENSGINRSVLLFVLSVEKKNAVFYGSALYFWTKKKNANPSNNYALMIILSFPLFRKGKFVVEYFEIKRKCTSIFLSF